MVTVREWLGLLDGFDNLSRDQALAAVMPRCLEATELSPEDWLKALENVDWSQRPRALQLAAEREQETRRRGRRGDPLTTGLLELAASLHADGFTWKQVAAKMEADYNIAKEPSSYARQVRAFKKSGKFQPRLFLLISSQKAA